MKRIWLVLIALLVLVVAGWFYTQRQHNDDDAEKGVSLPIRNFALNLDPKSMAETESRKVATLLYSGLIAVDQSGNIIPRIAQSWEQTSANTITFTLKSGLTFTNGEPITADAVVSSLCAAMQPDHVQSATLQGIDRETRPEGGLICTGLDASAGETVAITTSQPLPWLMDALSGPGGWIVDTQAEAGEYGVRPGSGPYVVQSIRADSEIVLHSRMNGSPVAPALDTVTFVYTPDDALLSQYFNAGRVDIIQVSSPTMLATLFDNGGEPVRDGAAVVEHSTDAVRVMVVNRRRLAGGGMSADMISQMIARLSLRIPRAAISERSRGLAEPLYTGFPPAASQVQSLIEPRLSSAEDGQTLTLLTENDAYSDLIGAMIANDSNGFDLDYRAVDKGLLIDALLQGEFDLALIRVEATWDSPNFWAAFFTPDDPYVAFGYPVEAFSNFDFAAPDAIEKANALVNREGNWIGVIQETGLVMHSGRVEGVRVTSTGQISLEEIRLVE